MVTGVYVKMDDEKGGFSYEHENFKDKAPITEALIDIRVTSPDGAEITALDPIREGWREQFPKMRKQTGWSGQIQLSEDTATTVTKTHGPRGYMLLSENEKHIAQVGLEGFTFSHLHPYRDWENLRDGARPIWESYLEALKPVRVSRVAVRYINRIEIPGPHISIPEWFHTGPMVADPLPSMGGFLVRLVLPHLESESVALVNLATESQTGDGLPGIVFDIDAYRVVDLEPGSDEVWKILDWLRHYKNFIFLKSLTDKTLELFR